MKVIESSKKLMVYSETTETSKFMFFVDQEKQAKFETILLDNDKIRVMVTKNGRGHYIDLTPQELYTIAEFYAGIFNER